MTDISSVKDSADWQARSLIRSASEAAFGTIGPDGFPYVSLVAIATAADGAPLLLISRLAAHTRHVAEDDRVSLLVRGPASDPDPLTGVRLTLEGRIEHEHDSTAKARYLARHPESQGYEEELDFNYFRIAPTGGQLVAGFGRIARLTVDQLLSSGDAVGAVAENESQILDHMNSDHADAVAFYATKLLNEPEGDWRMVGIDIEGCDLACDGRARRLDFETPLGSVGDARKTLAALAKSAR